jgi:hypothetical protein
VLLLADHEVEFNGAQVLKQCLDADSIAFRCQCCPLGDLGEAFSQVRRIEKEDGAAVGFGNSVEGLLGTDAGTIKRAAAPDNAPETDADSDTEIAQALGVNKRRLEIITPRPQQCPLLERV